MPHVMTSAPTIEPITLGEAKAHMRVDSDRDDALINALITTSRLQIEDTLELALIHQTWSFVMDCWPDTAHVELPIAPAATLLAVRTYDGDDVMTPIPLVNFHLDTLSRVPRVTRKGIFAIPAGMRPANGIEISYRAGFSATADGVPEALRQALRLLVAFWYDHREPLEAMKVPTKVPDPISQLLAPYRRVRIA